MNRNKLFSLCLFVAMLLIPWRMSAQTTTTLLSQDFNGISSSGSSFNVPGWEVSTDAYYSSWYTQNSCYENTVGVEYWPYGEPAVSDLKSPLFHIGANASLTFKYKKWTSGTLLQVIAYYDGVEHELVNDVPASQTDWAEHTVALTGIANKDVRLIFRGNISISGAKLYLDNIVVTGEEGSAEEEQPEIQPMELPFNMNFEDATKNSNWTYIQNGANAFVVGTAINNGGSSALYVSNDSSSHAYINNPSATAFAYIPLQLEANIEYKVKYDWWCHGEGSYDFGRAYLTDDLANCSTTTSIRGSGTPVTNPAGTLVTLDNGYMSNGRNATPVWTSYENRIVSVPTSGVYYLVFAWKNDGSDAYGAPFAVDNISFEEPACPNARLNTASISATTATFAFTTTGTTVQLAYGPAGTDAESCTKVDNITAANGYTLADLTANTAYVAYVRASCEGGIYGEWSSACDFSTTPNPVSIPVNADFEDAGFNANWNIESSASVGLVIGSGVNNGGSSALYVSADGSSYGTDVSIASNSYAYITVALEAGKAYVIEYDWSAFGQTSSYSNYDFGRAFITADRNVINPNNSLNSLPTTVIALDNGKLASNSEWTTNQVGFSVPATGNYYVVFAWTQNAYSGDTQNPLAIDNVEIREIACHTNSVSVIEIGDINAKVGITTDATTVELRWDVKPTEVDNCAAANTATIAADSILTIESLLPGTEYVVYARTICNGTNYGDWSSAEFKTLAAAATLPYSYGFEADNAAEEAAWTIADEGCANQLVIGSATACTGSRALYVSSDGINYNFEVGSYENTTYGYAFRPFRLEEGKTYGITFDYKSDGGYSNANIYLVKGDYTTTTGENVVPLLQNISKQPNWVKYTNTELEVNSTGVYFFVIRWYNATYGGTNTDSDPLAFDNLIIEEVTCARSKVAVKALGTTTATFGFSEIPSATIELAYGPAGTAADQCTIIAINDTANDYTLTNLTENTPYVAYVRSICSETDQSWWSDACNFRTMVTPTTVPYTQDFENSEENGKWVCAGEGANKFIIGTKAYNEEGTNNNALYISSDNDNNIYNTGSSECTAFAYRTITLETGKVYTVNYDWKSLGESGYDYARFYIASELDLTEEFDGYQAPAQYKYLDEGSRMQSQNTWTTMNTTVSVETTGSFYIVLFWKNDGSSGNNPPVAIDNFSITSCDPNYSDEVYDTICAGDSYFFGGENRTVAGDYTAELIDNATGCTLTRTLHLTVLEAANTVIEATICNGEEYIYEEQTFNTAGTHEIKRLTAANGCDSIVTLELTILDAITGTDAATICNGDEYVFGTQTLTVAGEYTEPFTAANGCDSIVTLELTVLDAITGTDAATICDGDEYVFGTQTLTVAGEYTETFTAANGCDSTVTLTLTVNEIPVTTIDTTVVTPSSFEYKGEIYNESTIINDTIVGGAANGCDSIVIINLTVSANDGGTGVDNSTANTVVIAPNPIAAGEMAYINGNFNEADVVAIEVYDATGALVKANNNPEAPLAIEGLNKTGVYFVRVITVNGNVLAGKLIVK